MSDDYERILLNRIRTPDGTVMTSYFRHDYRAYKDANGHTYMVDGGTAYLRRNVVAEAPYEECSVYLTDDHEENRKYFQWGSCGPEGDQPLQYRPLGELAIDHIEAILKTQTHIADWVRELFELELKHRLGIET